MIKKYRKKPVKIEAIEFIDTPERIEEIFNFIGDETIRVDYSIYNRPAVLIETLEGTMRADVGDYIIKGINGEFYPCKPDIFKKTYEEVQDESME